MKWLLVAVLCAGCRPHRPRPGESPAEVCTLTNHEKVVTVSGYFTASYAGWGCTTSCPMYISPERTVAEGVNAVFSVGVSPNQMRPTPPLGGSADPFDIFQVRDFTNRLARFNDVIRVRGRLTFTPGATRDPCRLEVTRVEIP